MWRWLFLDMSQRSQCIGGTFHSYQSEAIGNSRISGGSSLLSGPQLVYREFSRTLRRKPSSVKCLSPTPSLEISCAPHTTYYYSKSVINESYLTDDRGFSLKTNVVFDEPLESNSYWSEDLSLRRRRGTGGIKSNKKINGLGDRRTSDTYGSSSGSSSEDDYTEYIQFWVQECPLQSRVLFWVALSQLQALERYFETLETAASMLEFQKRKNTEGATLSYEDILMLLDKLMTQQEAVIREKLGSNIDLHLQNKLDDKLEEHLSNLKKEFVTLGSDQKALSRQVESLPGQIKKIEDETGKPFVQHEELQEQLCKLKHKVLAKINQELSVQGVEITLHKEGITGFTEEQIHHIVNDALKHYNEDHIGLKRMRPGNCWAFQGSQCFAVIRLPNRIHPTAVMLEHMSKSLPPSGTIPSAHKDIAVFGLEEEGHQESILLGKFTYNQDGDPIQTFHFQDTDRQAAFHLVERRVLSNWGHPE
ncbi:hypothetical protein E2320_019999 [Naja naja]|nr:hypothetical protein E2320_019999 [Naja naja]